ncbi:MAG: 23S rRNA (adenine(2503)-C(2))-methyltransferase RlmN [candidate division Zixibacteria bacterium]|nr:23S rRNA (adenine(2503)-C(2))-methyltransferase RlmN [candidate division Zixibacteria bacterium]
MSKINLLGKTLIEFEQIVTDLGEKPFKGRQLFKWLYNIGQYDFDKMTDLSLQLREKLNEMYIFEDLNLIEKKSSSDFADKLLFRLDDNKLIETVAITEGDNRTICVSSQAGCALGCKYCATGKLGFGRDLTVGEMIGQFLTVRKLYGEEVIGNIVFMGMGEPLLNYDNLINAIKIITSDMGLAIPARKITISTAGIIPKIIALADSGMKVNLAISLNSAFAEKRKILMPVANKYNLDKLFEAARYFARKRKKMITFEYILFKGINDSIADAKKLTEKIKGISCKINLLAYNPVDGLDYERPSEKQVDHFAGILSPMVPVVTVRKSRGADISAACGQLAGDKIGYKKRSS